jgi:3-hydroxyisobutyrate dehydrogenase
MDEKILTNILKVSSSRCWSVDTYNPVPGVMENVPASRNYDGGFACDLMLKDLKLAVEVAKEVNIKVELG